MVYTGELDGLPLVGEGRNMLQHVVSPVALARGVFIAAGLYWLRVVQVGRWHPHPALLSGLQETHSWKQTTDYGCEKNSPVSPSVYHPEARRSGMVLAQAEEGWEGKWERNLPVGDIWQESDASHVPA